MLIIRPAAITDAALQSSTVADSPAAWAAGTTYALGDQVQDLVAHHAFESLQANNVGHPLTDQAWWLDVGPTNRWAMFDGVNGTQTVADNQIEINLLIASKVDAIAILNAQAGSAQIICTVGGVEKYDQTVLMGGASQIDDWYEYFYAPFDRMPDVILTDLPAFSNMKVRVILSNPGGEVKVGTLVVGQTLDIGITLAGMSVGIIDYSRKSVDDFGNYVLVKRAFSKKVEARVVVDNAQVDTVIAALSQLRATPIVWMASDYASGFVFGFYRDFTTTFDYPGQSVCLLEIEGLT